MITFYCNPNPYIHNNGKQIPTLPAAYPVEKKQHVVIHKNFTYSCFLFSLESFRCLPLGTISAAGARLRVERAANKCQVQYSVSF